MRRNLAASADGAKAMARRMIATTGWQRKKAVFIAQIRFFEGLDGGRGGAVTVNTSFAPCRVIPGNLTQRRKDAKTQRCKDAKMQRRKGGKVRGS